MIIIGIAGVPAGGKSTVAAQLAGLGATWINADQIAHEVLEAPAVIGNVVERFGPAIVGECGKIDRRKLAKVVFGDDDAGREGLRYLEHVIHPPTRRMIQEQIALADRSKVPAVVLDIPLLFESGWANQCDEIWFIDTSESIQLAACGRRGWTTSILKLRQSRQLPREEKRRLSTRVVPNDDSLESLQRYVQKLWHDCVHVSAIDNAQSTLETHCHPT